MQDLFTSLEGNDVLPIPPTPNPLIQTKKRPQTHRELVTLALFCIRDAHL